MRKIKHYPDEEKLSLLEEFRASSVSMNQFQKFHGLGHCTISKWMTKFGLSNEKSNSVVLKMSKNRKKTPSSADMSRRILEARIQQLEQELKAEKLRALAYKTMIEVAEEELGVDISKKAGAKQ